MTNQNPPQDKGDKPQIFNRVNQYTDTPQEVPSIDENTCDSSDCLMDAWVCNRLQDLVYDDIPINDRRKLAVEMRHQETAHIKQQLQAREASIRNKYEELIMAVGNKYEGETRHQTALRYIRQAEQGNNNIGKELEKEE